MKKLTVICFALMLLFVLSACGVKEAPITGESDWMFSQSDLAQVSEGNTDVYINGEKMNNSTASQMLEEINETVSTATGTPDGFPKSMPIYSGAQIMEADAYGTNGYTMIYTVSAPYASVVSFYQSKFTGIEKEYDEPDECYFENFDIDGGKVHINGLTITDNDENTMVFITLKYN